MKTLREYCVVSLYQRLGSNGTLLSEKSTAESSFILFNNTIQSLNLRGIKVKYVSVIVFRVKSDLFMSVFDVNRTKYMLLFGITYSQSRYIGNRQCS